MTSSDIIAISSVVVAVLALFATAYQAWVTRHHNRLSVRPHLVWHIDRKNNDRGASITFSVKNLGLGPAIVTDRYFTKDKVRFKAQGLQTDEVSDFLSFVLEQKIDYALNRFGLPGRRAAIPSQGEVVIAEIELLGAGIAQLAIAEQLAGDVAFHLVYESLYGEKNELHVD